MERTHETPKHRRGRTRERWRLRLWLAFVTIVTIAFWLVSRRLNPAHIPTWLAIPFSWGWIWAWWRAHHILPGMAVHHFGPRMLVVSLTMINLVWSLSFALYRPLLVAHTVHPQTRDHVVVTHTTNGTNFRFHEESMKGLLLDEVRRYEYGYTRPLPKRFELQWTEEGRAMLYGDGIELAGYKPPKRNRDETREIIPGLPPRHGAVNSR